MSVSSRLSSFASVALSAALLSALGGVAVAAEDDTILVSRGSGPGGAPGDQGGGWTSVSASGRFVAFTSDSTNLSAEDQDEGDPFQAPDTDPANRFVTDVFVRDLARGTTTYASRATGVSGAPGDSDSSSPSISANGRFLAFASRATTLSTVDNDQATDPESRIGGSEDVFVRDLRRGVTTFVSRSNGVRGAAADSDSTHPSISADGRFVAFESDARNLSRSDRSLDRYGNFMTDVFVRDLKTHRTELVSRASGARGAGGDSESARPSISADGRYVAFRSYADNLSAADHERGDVFVRDRKLKRTILVSRASGRTGAGGLSDSWDPSISDDGRLVAFFSDASNLSPPGENGDREVYVRDLKRRRTTLVSRGSGARGPVGDKASFEPEISADGRFVTFTSDATNLSAEDDDTPPPPGGGFAFDVFTRDLRHRTTDLVSRASGAAGRGGDMSSLAPSISADGRFVAFTSFARNLTTDGAPGVFVRDLLGPDVTPPRLTHLSRSRRRFSVSGAANGTIFRYTLSEFAAVKIRFERVRAGRYRAAGTLSRLPRSGRVAVRFSGRIRRRPLKPGRYRATFVAVDVQGNQSRPHGISFRIVRR